MNKLVKELTKSERTILHEIIRKGYRKGRIGGLEWELVIGYTGKEKEDIYKQIETVGLNIYYGKYFDKGLNYRLQGERVGEEIISVEGAFILSKALEMGYCYGKIGEIEWELHDKDEYILDLQGVRYFVMQDGKLVNIGLTHLEQQYIDTSIGLQVYSGQVEDLVWKLEKVITEEDKEYWELLYKRLI